MGFENIPDMKVEEWTSTSSEAALLNLVPDQALAAGIAASVGIAAGRVIADIIESDDDADVSYNPMSP